MTWMLGCSNPAGNVPSLSVFAPLALPCGQLPISACSRKCDSLLLGFFVVQSGFKQPVFLSAIFAPLSGHLSRLDSPPLDAHGLVVHANEPEIVQRNDFFDAVKHLR